MENIKLQNVDPITYLRSLNKLADYYESKSKSQPKIRGVNQIALQPFTKFPISKHFDKIQGIYTNITQKRNEETDRAKQRFNLQDQEFMQRHRQFMARTLTRMIEDNKTHIGIIEKSKTFYLLKEARKKNVQGQVRLASRGLRETGSAVESRTHKTERDQAQTRQQLYQTDQRVLNVDSFKNPKPIIFRVKREADLDQATKIKNTEQVDKILAEKRMKRISQQKAFLESSSTTRNTPKDSPNNTLTRRSQSLLGSQFTSLFQSRSGSHTAEHHQQDIFDPEKYVKGRFQDPTVKLRYDYQRGQKQMSEKFKKRLAYHYLNDQKMI